MVDISVDPTKWAALLDILQKRNAKKQKPAVAQYLKVQFAGGAVTKYYATSAYSSVSPFRGVKKYTGGEKIEPRIMGKDPFLRFAVNSDIRTENIPIELNDTDGAIKALFEAYGAGKAELYEYYPDVDLNYNPWWGQILPPPDPGELTQKTVLTNGYRPPTRMLPSSPLPKECRFIGTFGLSTADKQATSGCPYDRGCGGSMGNLDPATGRPYTRCSGTKAACIARLPVNSNGYPKYYGGTDLEAAAVPADNHPGNLAISKGNKTIRNKPVPWLFGTKHVRGLDLLLWARLPNPNQPDEARIRLLHRGPEGPIQSIANLKINEKIQQPGHDWAWRLGERGQAGGYPGLEQETFSSLSLVYSAYGFVDPNVTGPSLAMEADMVGYTLVAVFSDAETFTRVFSDDRVWCTVEMYTNQKAGLGYELGRWHIDELLDVSEWGRKISTFKLIGEDGEERTFAGRRTTFDALLEARPAIDQISDVCRSGRISIPFQYDGKYTMAAMKVFTQDELDDAVVFSDHGPNKNIFFEGHKPVEFDQTRDDQLMNELTLTFEEATNFDVARPIVGNDPEQQAKASKIAGDQALQVVPAQMAAVGVRHEQEAVKLLYYTLWFNELGAQPGGTKNNCRGTHIVPYEWTLGLRRYAPCKFDLRLMSVPKGPTGRAQVMKATGVGTASSSGNITVTVTAASLTGSPIAVPVAIVSGDTPAVWIPKVRAALQANGVLDDFFLFRASGADLYATSAVRAANDTTWNIAIAAGTTGITSDPTSTITVTGIADGPFEWFRILDIKRIDRNLAQITTLAYNKVAYEAFEVEGEDPPPPGGVCSIDADCSHLGPDYVCRDGVCVPGGGGGGRAPAFGTITFNESTGQLEVPIEPCV